SEASEHRPCLIRQNIEKTERTFSTRHEKTTFTKVTNEHSCHQKRTVQQISYTVTESSNNFGQIQNSVYNHQRF
ncbi:MAG TPA: hypothetical protein PLK95_10905, partial [Pseudothermotoga sp.]|nr:hypothetical protein [Pseudothermotoga sp.]